ncbi:MAG: ATP-binding protein [Conexivisphaerales archaeon]
MKVLSKKGDEIQILALSGDKIEKGDYLIIDDGINPRMIVQVFDETYLDSTGIDEEILRDELFTADKMRVIDPDRLQTISYMIRDARILRSKIRGTVISGKFNPEIGWLPSRAQSSIRRISQKELNGLFEIMASHPIVLGKNAGQEEVIVDAADIDGSLSIITGRKESGKSHLAKLLLSELVRHGAYVFVLDLNNEYSGLASDESGNPSDISDRLKILEPGSNMLFTLKYLGKRVLSEILTHALDTPSITVREYMKIWDQMNEEGDISIRNLYSKINTVKVNDMVRDALISRYYSMLSTRIFANSDVMGIDFKALIGKHPNGGGFLFSMAKMSPMARRVLVQILLSKLVDLLENEDIPPVFIFAEEAHLYFEHTYWEDALTRMRHFGIFFTFITNQPDSLNATVYRQADNVFLFNFINEKDLEMIAQSSRIDGETVRELVRSLPSRKCLAIGKAVKDLPVIVKVRELPYNTRGRTKKFFTLKGSPDAEIKAG